MQNLPIIKTLGDTDLYKITMGLCVNQHFGEADVTYRLTMRSDIDVEPEEVRLVEASLKSMGAVSFSEEELTHLQKKAGYYLPGHFMEFLRGLRLDTEQVRVWSEGSKLRCEVRGPWWQSIYWEIFVLATISEVLAGSRAPLTAGMLDAAYERARAKGSALREIGAAFIDMGTRRRRSYAAQEAVLRGLRDGGQECFLGTSNIHFAAKLGSTPQGTMAHELFSAVAAMYGVENANNIVLGKWAETYHGNLGTALPDTFTTEFFLRTFNPFYAKLFDGLRQDSGDPLIWTDRILAHYERFGILPAGKKLVYSDGLNSVERVKQILNHCGGRVQAIFGIGTWFTNDFDDLPAPNMVFKLVEAQKNRYEPRRQAVKLSDAPGKHNGDAETVREYLKRIDG